MENPLSSDNTMKSRVILVVSWIIIVISILIPIVFLKSGVYFSPGTFGFIQRWLSPPYIYLVLNLVIVSIFASPTLLHSLSCLFNYFKEAKDRQNKAISGRVDKPTQPASSLVATSTTPPTSLDGHFYQDWQEFIHDQTPTSLSLPLERELLDAPWPDINDLVANSIKTANSFVGRERATERNFAKKVKERGDIVSPLSLPEIKSIHEFNENKSLKSTSIVTKRATNERGAIVSPIASIDTDENNYACELTEDETLDATWQAIMEGGETVSHPSTRQRVSHSFIGETVSNPCTLSISESERVNVPSRLISPRVPRQDALAAFRELRKSETFNETVSAQQRAGLRRDPSLSLDDLNCRVESFIKNFNHQMLLQRQESEQRFSEMINSGGY